MSKIPQSLPSGITKLTKLLEHLHSPPKLTLKKNVKMLRVSLAYNNEHLGAKHFVKTELPRIQFHNPDVDIEVTRWRKQRGDDWRPEIEVRYDDGKLYELDMDKKYGPKILEELMNVAGGDPWLAHVQEAKRTGQPVVPFPPTLHAGAINRKNHDAKVQAKAEKAGTPKEKPNLWEWLAANPDKGAAAFALKNRRRADQYEEKAQREKAAAAVRVEGGDVQVKTTTTTTVEVKEKTTVRPDLPPAATTLPS